MKCKIDGIRYPDGSVSTAPAVTTPLIFEKAGIYELTVKAYVAFEKQYQIADRETFLADFREGLAETLDNDGSLTVDVAGIDVEKGLLSVWVTANICTQMKTVCVISVQNMCSSILKIGRNLLILYTIRQL